MPELKNVVLDMGNVLLRYDPQVSLDRFCRTDEEKEQIRNELFLGPEWAQGDLGLIREEEKFDLVKRRVPKELWEPLKQCCEQWDICMKPLPGALEFCRAVKGRGCRLFVLSNASDSFYRIFPREMPTELFDGFVISADLHLCKPDLRIYEHLLEKFGLTAQECLFLDDSLENVKGARAAGLRAHHFQGDFSREWAWLQHNFSI